MSIVADQVLATLRGLGQNAAGAFQTERGAVKVLASENHADAAQGTYLRLYTTPTGSTTQAAAWDVSNAGHLVSAAARRIAIVGTAGSAFTPASGVQMQMESGDAAEVFDADRVGGQCNFRFTSYHTTPVAQFFGRTARGNRGTPTASQSGDVLARISGGGYDNAFTTARVRIEFKAAATWAPSSPGPVENSTEIVFATTASATASITDRWKISKDGHLLAATDGAVDIGATGANRPNAAFFKGVITSLEGTATTAGGAKALGLGASGPHIYVGSGAPTASAVQGSLYLRTDGSSTSTRAYINTNGSTTWTAITTVA